jgi:AraC-like DNA-binding protein
MCRTFRRETGTTLHQYRHQLRVRASLEPLRESREPLVELALRLGFSSHSHFASAFRREFGLAPSGLRSASLGTA